MEAKKIIIKDFIIWRLLLFVPLIIGAYLLPERLGFRFEDTFSTSNLFLKSFVFPWANFDGARYISIAVNGYITEAAFFPLYPVLISARTTNLSLTFLSGFILSNGAFLLSLFVLYKLLTLDYSSKISRSAIIYLLVFPTSFFFGSVYSESLFLLLLLASFYFARKGEWFKASFLGGLLSLTRLVGIFILPALLVELYLQREKVEKIASKFYQLLLIPLGFLSYCAFNYLKWGDWLYFIKAHGELGNSRSVDSVVLFPQTVFRYIKILLSVSSFQYEWWIALLEISSFIFGGLLLYMAYKNRIRISYFIFSVMAFLLPASSGTFSGLPRYLIVIFPIFMVTAIIKNRFLKAFYIVVSVVLQFLLLMFFSRGYFVA